MTAGPRSRPPDLPNFEYRSWLGGGGFADVFLYQQLRPQRQVAVKVLRTSSLDAQDQQAFDAEANLMARVSAHPYIVTIYGADTAPDGRPFLVMEYFPKPHFGQRSRGTGLPVQEVLRVGVRVASAVETAHHAGILHHDIKPANILVSEYDRPGLTDFGIAGAHDGSDLVEAQGVTIPYAPPEVLGTSATGTAAADVYSLAATLYAILAGRAPFEVTGGDNSAAALLQRTLSSPVPAVGRHDVPRSLELLLGQALAKDPTHRPVSAAAFARSLQSIEQELQLAVTDFELAGDVLSGTAPAKPENDDSTRAGRIQVVHQGDAPTAARGSVPISGVPSDLTQSRGLAEPVPVPSGHRPAAPAATETVVRPRPAAAAPAVQDPVALPSARRSTLLVAVCGAAVLAVVLAVMLTARSGDRDGTSTTTTSSGSNYIGNGLSEPTKLTVVRTDGVITVAWEAEDESDTYFTIIRTDGAEEVEVLPKVLGSPVTIPDSGSLEPPCFKVLHWADGRAAVESAEMCALK